jgi:hypothetical protein
LTTVDAPITTGSGILGNRSFRAQGSLLGIGAIKRLGPHHAEIKSMHTAEGREAAGSGGPR